MEKEEWNWNVMVDCCTSGRCTYCVLFGIRRRLLFTRCVNKKIAETAARLWAEYNPVLIEMKEDAS